MRRNHSSIDQIQFANPRLNRVGVEVISLESLRLHAADTLAAPQRVAFHFLLLLTDGVGQHTVDFAAHKLQPGCVVYVRPGQVQQWHMHEDLQGLCVLIKPEALTAAIGRTDRDMRLLGLEDWITVCQPSDLLVDSIHREMIELRSNVKEFDDSEMAAALVWSRVRVCLFMLARSMQTHSASGIGGQADLFARYVRALERMGHVRQPLTGYADQLGCSDSTLNRACLAMSGKTAKRLQDERTLLEAKRMLVHSPMPIADIGHLLGFSEATNFVKFFGRLARMTPLQFRQTCFK